jgi:HEPN domain-containing protein
MKDKIVKEWFERAKHDFEAAKLIFAHGDYYDEVVFLLHQAVEKYLKGYLIFQGCELKKIHDIYILLSEAVKFNKSFEEFLVSAKKLTAFYYEERYPPGPPPDVSEEEAKEIIEATEKIIALVKKDTGL